MGERKGKSFMFWLDLECTGSGDDEHMLEIGAVITDRDLNELDSKSIVLGMAPDRLEKMSDVVLKMHTSNGLLDEVMQRGIYPSEMHRDIELAQIDEELATWVRSFAGGDHIPFAGSGVAWYDRKFIKRDLPLLDKRLSYVAEDLGAVRRVVDRAGIKWPEFHYTKSHRALDDARQHIEEMRRFLAWLRKARSKIGAQI